MRIPRAILNRLLVIVEKETIDKGDPLRMSFTAAAFGYHDVAVWILNNKEAYKLLYKNHFKVKEVMKLIDVTYTYNCGLCEAKHTVTCSIRLGQQIPKPSMPEGWQRINDVLICKEHEIKLYKEGVIVDETKQR